MSCSSTSRVFVHESLHDDVLDALVAESDALPVGLPWEDGKEVGPIVSAQQCERVTASSFRAARRAWTSC